jgi:putative flippase GtrA
MTRVQVMELVRYYQAGVLNTAFGLGGYALLVWLGTGRYGAQAIAHVLGMGFNYVTYTRHVFRDSQAAKTRFVLSYAGNYLMGLACLAAVSRIVRDPYLAGVACAFGVSVLNYFVLRHLVFR